MYMLKAGLQPPQYVGTELILQQQGREAATSLARKPRDNPSGAAWPTAPREKTPPQQLLTPVGPPAPQRSRAGSGERGTTDTQTPTHARPLPPRGTAAAEGEGARARPGLREGLPSACSAPAAKVQL